MSIRKPSSPKSPKTKTDATTRTNNQKPAKPEQEPIAKKPRSPAQLEASRINGAKSRGPKTAAGKAISSKNALRHGLTANSNTLLENELPSEYAIVYNAFVNDFRPKTQTELRFIEKLANLDWRLERIVMMETALFNVELGTHDSDIKARWKSIDDIGVLASAWKSSADTSHALDLLRRYAATLQSQFNTTLKNFRALETARLDPRRVRDLDIEPPYESPALFPEQPPELELEELNADPEPNPTADSQPVNRFEPGPHPSTHHPEQAQPQQIQFTTTTNPKPQAIEKPEQNPNKKAA